MKNSVFSVSEINQYISKLLLSDYILSNLSIKGEASNVKYHSNGRLYLTLKDSVSSLNVIVPEDVVLKLNSDIYDGTELIVTGKIQLSINRGGYSLICNSLEEIGAGLQYKAFLQLKDKLEKEGLFSIEKKKEIPRVVTSIGIITSKTGAVIHDIVKTINNSNYKINIYLFPTTVQGVDAIDGIIRGIEFFNSIFFVDLIIIGRGGGSYEDLSAFNDEKLARNIYDSKIPIISAVGHQTDFVISDFVSDIRASTPTQAAEIVINNNKNFEKELIFKLNLLIDSFKSSINFKYQNLSDKILQIEKLSPEKNIENKINILKLKFKELNKINEILNSKNVSLFNHKNLLKKVSPEKELKFKDLRLDSSINELNSNILNKFNDLNKLLYNNYNILLNLNPKLDKSNMALISKEENEYINSVNNISLNEYLFIELKDGIIKVKTCEIIQKEENI